MFVPHAGALILLAALTAFLNLRQQNWPQLLAYVFGCALAPAAVLAYLLEQHTLVAAFDDVVRYTAGHYTSVNVVPFGFETIRLNHPLKYIFPVAGLLTLLVCASDRRAGLRDRRLWGCASLSLSQGSWGASPAPTSGISLMRRR
jgi:hypothetical protein